MDGGTQGERVGQGTECKIMRSMLSWYGEECTLGTRKEEEWEAWWGEQGREGTAVGKAGWENGVI